LLRQFKPDGPPGLFLPNGSPIDGIAIRSNVLDLEGDDITTSQFAVDGQIEQGQIVEKLVSRPDLSHHAHKGMLPPALGRADARD